MSVSDQYEYGKSLGISRMELRKLEISLGMDSGYVLSFSDRTFDDFMIDNFNLDFSEEQFHRYGTSKAKRLRAGFFLLGNEFFNKFLKKVKLNWDDLKIDSYNSENSQVSEIVTLLINKSEGLSPIESADAINPRDYIDDKDFMSVAREVKRSIDENKPVEGLDRLHTFMFWYLRDKCSLLNIALNKETPLHSLMGMLVKELNTREFIESEMTNRILKSTISWFDVFNDVRNSKSLAHANKLLNYSEAQLIYSSVCSVIKFIDSLSLKVADAVIDKESNEYPF